MKTLTMTSQIRLISMSLLLLSMMGMGCTSLQQTTVNTTDDLYFTPNNKETPAPTATAKQNRNKYQSEQEELANEDEYQDYQTYPDDRYLRLKVANRNRWDAIDDFGYWNDPRYNYAYYPSYGGWNNWYTGYYGSSWYNPFGVSMGFGWGGYAPYSSYYSLGWGFNDFGYGGYGSGLSMSFGYGFGFGGYGGWSPYYSNYWNPYGYYYPNYGGYYGGMPMRRVHYQNPAATRLSAPGMAAYRNTSNSRGYNNSFNTTNGNTRYTGNSNLNNNFGSLLKRVVTNDNNANNANSWDRPVRRFNNGNQPATNQVRPNNYTNNSSSNSNTVTPSNNNAGGRSGGYNSSGSSTGGGRAPRNQP